MTKPTNPQPPGRSGAFSFPLPTDWPQETVTVRIHWLRRPNPDWNIYKQEVNWTLVASSLVDTRDVD